MISTAITTFLILCVGYAILRVAHRAYNSESETKTALKKKFKGLFGADNEESKQQPSENDDQPKPLLDMSQDDTNEEIRYVRLDHKNKESFMESATSKVKNGLMMIPGVSEIKNKIMGNKNGEGLNFNKIKDAIDDPEGLFQSMSGGNKTQNIEDIDLINVIDQSVD